MTVYNNQQAPGEDHMRPPLHQSVPRMKQTNADLTLTSLKYGPSQLPTAEVTSELQLQLEANHLLDIKSEIEFGTDKARITTHMPTQRSHITNRQPNTQSSQKHIEHKVEESAVSLTAKLDHTHPQQLAAILAGKVTS